MSIKPEEISYSIFSKSIIGNILFYFIYLSIVDTILHQFQWSIIKTKISTSPIVWDLNNGNSTRWYRDGKGDCPFQRGKSLSINEEKKNSKQLWVKELINMSCNEEIYYSNTSKEAQSRRSYCLSLTQLDYTRYLKE